MILWYGQIIEMKLSKKGTIWSIIIGLLISLNSLLTLVAVRELEVTNRLTSHDYEIGTSVRQLRNRVLEYYALGLDAAQPQAARSDRQKFIEIRQQLITQLKEKRTSPLHFELDLKLEAAKEKIKGLLSFEPRINSESTAISLLNPNFRLMFDSVQNELNVLANQSNQTVSSDRAHNESRIEQLLYISLGLFFLSFFMIVATLIYFHRDILLPIQSLVETLQKIRSGNLTARWEHHRKDEIGLIGQTVNETVAELEQRRADRIQLISAIAHDLKNPLTAMSLSCDLILNKGPRFTKEATNGIIMNVRSQVDRLRRMADDLLNAASAVKPSLELKISKINLIAVVLEISELFRNSYPDRQFIFVPENKVLEIFADHDRIAQTLTNLLSNAIKYSQPGTEIELGVGLNLSTNSAYIEIRDRGIGIPKDKVDTIFQPFARLENGKTMSTGLGLGLATVSNIVRAHSGIILVQPRQEKGTVFRIELPVEGPNQVQASESHLAS